MSRQSLINYIKRSLAKGYNPEQIRDALINAGHSPYEIDVLLKSVAYKHKHSRLWIIAAVVFALIILVFVLLLALPEEKAPSIKLSALQTEIAQGESLVLNVQITNPSENRINVALDFMVFAPSGPLLMSKKKIIMISDYLTKVHEQLPIDLEPGKYKLLLTAKMGDYVLTQETYFEVTTEISLEKPTITTPLEQADITKECIGGCDDYNACTKDECINAECVHTPITPCCGNGICEEGEEQTCQIDCIPEKETIKKRPASAEQAARECEKIATLADKDLCFEKAATEFGIGTLCKKISNSVKRDSCYMYFAFNKDFTYCDRIENQYTKNSCLQLKKMNEMMSNYPSNPPNMS